MEFERIADQKRLDFIIDALEKNLPANSVVLDVGCGNGVISRALGQKGYNVYGIDISENAISKARKLNTSPNVTFDVLSAEQLEVSGKKYDAIICSEVLEHLQNPSALLKVLHSSLDENGVLIVTVPNGKGPREMFVTKPVIALQKKNNWVWRLLQRIKKSFGYTGTTVQSDASDLTHIQFFTLSSLKELARSNKFWIARMGKTNFIEDVFPFSLVAKKIKFFQRLDCSIAEMLPISFTGGFVSIWKKNTDGNN